MLSLVVAASAAPTLVRFVHNAAQSMPVVDSSINPCNAIFDYQNCTDGFVRGAALTRMLLRARTREAAPVAMAYDDTSSRMARQHPDLYLVSHRLHARSNAVNFTSLTSTNAVTNFHVSALKLADFIESGGMPLCGANYNLPPVWGLSGSIRREFIFPLTAEAMGAALAPNATAWGFVVPIQPITAEYIMAALTDYLQLTYSLVATRGTVGVAVLVCLYVSEQDQTLCNSAPSIVQSLGWKFPVVVIRRDRTTTSSSPVAAVTTAITPTITVVQYSTSAYVIGVDVYSNGSSAVVGAFPPSWIPPPEVRDAQFAADEASLKKEYQTSQTANPTLLYSAVTVPWGRETSDKCGGACPWTILHPCRHRACPLGKIWNAATRYSSPADTDFVMLNGGALRKGWSAGPVSASQVFDSSPFYDKFCVLQLRGVWVWAMLNHSAAYGAPNDTGIFNIPTGRLLQTEGIRYSYDSLAPMDSPTRITALSVRNRITGAWEPLRRSQLYQIVTRQYVCDGGDGYLPFVSQAEGRWSLGTIFEVMSVWANSLPNTTLTAELAAVDPQTPKPDYGAIAAGAAGVLLAIQSPAECRVERNEYYDPPGLGCVACPAGTRAVASVAAAGGASPCVPVVVDGGGTRVNVPLAVGLSVAGGVLLLVGVAAVIWRLTADKRRLAALYSDKACAEGLADAIADLRLDDVAWLEAIPRPSPIQKAFLRIVTRLRQYLAFLPQAVIEQVQHDGEEEDVSVSAHAPPGAASPVTPGAPGAPIIVRTDASSDGRSSVSDGPRRASLAPSLTKGHRRTSRMVAAELEVTTQLQSRPCSLVFIRGPEPTTPGPEVASACKVVVDAAAAAVAATRGGVVEIRDDGSVLILFNTVRRCAAHMSEAAAAAFHVSRDVAHAVVVVCTDVAVCGAIGDHSVRRLAVVSGMASRASLIAAAAGAFLATGKVLGDELLARGVEGEVASLPLERVVVPDGAGFRAGISPPTRFLVYELVAKRAVQTDEWMYELAEAHSATQKDPGVAMFTLWQRLLRGDLDGVQQAAPGVAAAHPTTARLVERLLAIKSADYRRPLGVLGPPVV